MPPKKEDVIECQLKQLFVIHAKSIERLAWKNMDADQFVEAHLVMLKALLKITTSPLKSQMSVILDQVAFNLSSAEALLFAEKVKGAVSYCRKKSRDAGSGKFMPAPVQALAKLLKKPSLQKAASGKAKPRQEVTKEVAAKKSIRSVFGLGEKQKKPGCCLSAWFLSCIIPYATYFSTI